MLTIEKVKLSQLRGADSEINARKMQRSSADAELLASIKTLGLIQPLAVRKSEDGYEVVDGNRRLKALLKINGKKDVAVPVTIQPDGDKAAREISLAANVVRAPLHPVDEYDGYQRLVEDGLEPAEIAARFGIKEKWVRQRLQLCRLAPELRDAWRAGKLTAEQAEALSIVADHERQTTVWREANKGLNKQWAMTPDALRRRMSETSVHQNDARVKAIGVDAYVAAGGAFSDDLFADTRLLLDVKLVDRLVEDRIRERCDQLIAEGWVWAMPETDFKIPRWQRKTLDLAEYFTADEAKAAAGKNWERKSAAEDAAIARAVADPAARAKTGALVGIDHEGGFDIDYLVVTTASRGSASAGAQVEDEPDENADDGRDDPSESTQDDRDDAPKVNYALRERLSETLTLAVSRALAKDKHIATVALTAALEVSLTSYGNPTPLRISTSDAWPGVAPERAYEVAPFATKLREVSELSVHAMLARLAQWTAAVLDLRHPRFEPRHDWDNKRGAIIAQLVNLLDAGSVRAEIANAFDADAHFKSVSAEACKMALVEMGTGGTLPQKKAALAELAAARAKATGWLPVELRTPAYEGPSAQVLEAAQ